MSCPLQGACALKSALPTGEPGDAGCFYQAVRSIIKHPQTMALPALAGLAALGSPNTGWVLLTAAGAPRIPLPPALAAVSLGWALMRSEE